MSTMATPAPYNFEESKLLWTPLCPGHAVCEKLRREINMKRELDLKDFHELHAYSVSDYNFWLDLWDFLGIVSSVPPNPSKIVTPGPIPERPSWFVGARLNYAENLLWRNDDDIAITAAYEHHLYSGSTFSHVKHYTFRELRGLVGTMAAGMRRAGLRVGDRVAAIITNSISGVVIALAASSIGAVFSSTATDMGASAILDRYRQIRPKILFASSETVYAGKSIVLVDKIKEVEAALREGGYGLERAVVLKSDRTGEVMEVDGCQTIDAFLARHGTDEDYPLTFEQLPFDHPLYILYSSGTSGPPKCIVHCAGGALMNSKKDCYVGFGILPTDVYFQYTTTAWMMWPYMLTGLACGARIVLYEGSPFYPDVKEYLRFIDWAGVTVLGTSPRFLSELQARKVKPLSLHPNAFASLREMTVTGSVLSAQLMTWAHAAFGGKLHIGSSSGGTDVFCAFVTSVLSFPLYAGELQGPALGMAVSVYSPSGTPLSRTLSTPGELVITRPHPSIPLGFYNDSTHTKFREAYFSTYPGVWRQGDFIVRNPVTGGYVFLGRSDGVLNPSGVRFGSAEVYALIEPGSEKFREVEDVLCIGQRRAGEDDERVLLFLKMRAGSEVREKLREKVKATIRQGLSRRHVPAGIFQVADIPYTVNGKKIEIAVKQIVSGVDVVPSGTVANPESFKLYYKFRDFEKMMKEEAEESSGSNIEQVGAKAKL